MRTMVLITISGCAYIADVLTPNLPAYFGDAVFYGGLALGLHWLLSLSGKEDA